MESGGTGFLSCDDSSSFSDSLCLSFSCRSFLLCSVSDGTLLDFSDFGLSCDEVLCMTFSLLGYSSFVNGSIIETRDLFLDCGGAIEFVIRQTGDEIDDIGIRVITRLTMFVRIRVLRIGRASTAKSGN